MKSFTTPFQAAFSRSIETGVSRDVENGKGTVRIKDVAKLAQVSTATVSRALSNPDIVSAQTREAVLAAVAETGYSANLAARNLRRQRTGAVMALVPNLANPFFSEILAGMVETLHPLGLNLIVSDTRAVQGASRSLLDYANRSHADGLLILDGQLGPALLSRPQCPPLVQVCERLEGVDSPCLLADNVGGTRAAVAHLADLGHDRIGRVMGPAGNSLTRDRSKGFRAGMVDAGAPIRDDWTWAGDFSLASGRAAALRLMALPERPTAVVCDNDEMACGFISAVLGAGLSVPDDIAVTGFDDIDIARHITPALTTVRQPRREIGAAAAAALFALIEGEGSGASRTFPVELRVRGSTVHKSATAQGAPR